MHTYIHTYINKVMCKYMYLHIEYYICKYGVLGITRHEVRKLRSEIRETIGKFENEGRIFQQPYEKSGTYENRFASMGKLFQSFSENINMHIYAPTKCI